MGLLAGCLPVVFDEGRACVKAVGHVDVGFVAAFPWKAGGSEEAFGGLKVFIYEVEHFRE